MLKILFLILVLLFTGCEQKHFSHVYDKTEIGAKISSISLKYEEDKNKNLYKTKLKEHGFKLTTNSPYTIKIESRLYPKKCNNPLATSEQKSYIGFVKLTLFKAQKRIYLCQSDFREKDEIQETFEDLIDIMIDEMKLRFEP